MNAADVDAHKLITCPYNMAHQIQQYRMQTHLVKCRKQYPNSQTGTCPFDAKHIVNLVEMDYHVSVCPERSRMDRLQYEIEDCSEYRSLAEPAPTDLPAEEDWDDANCSTYNPEEAKANKHHVLKKIRGATKSERRQVRMEGVRSHVPIREDKQ